MIILEVDRRNWSKSSPITWGTKVNQQNNIKIEIKTLTDLGIFKLRNFRFEQFLKRKEKLK